MTNIKKIEKINELVVKALKKSEDVEYDTWIRERLLDLHSDLIKHIALMYKEEKALAGSSKA